MSIWNEALPAAGAAVSDTPASVTDSEAKILAARAALRPLRVGETMRRTLSEILSRGALEHLPLAVTITEVRVSPDLRHASVFLLPFGAASADADMSAVLAVLERNSGMLRTRLAAGMRLKRAPTLSFALDRSFDAAREVDRLLAQPKVARDLRQALAHPSPPPVSLGVRPSSGWLILDKPRGISSAQAVARVKRAFSAGKSAPKAGHCGTLDPAAEGVLPIALGEATKLASLLADAPKTYRFALAWGVATDSDDAEGKVIAVSDARPTVEAIRAALPEFLGEREQIPPRFSAIHVGGRRAYARARSGEDFAVPPRIVRLHRARFLEEASAGEQAHFEISCSAGFYVRSLARDLGERLGTCAHVTWLRRAAVGGFGEDVAVGLGESANHLPPHLLPLESIVQAAGVETVAVTGEEAARLRHGRRIFLSLRQEKNRVECKPTAAPPSGLMLALREGEAVALVRRASAGDIKPVRVVHGKHAPSAARATGNE